MERLDLAVRSIAIAAALAGYGLTGACSAARARSWGPLAAGFRRGFERLGPAFVKLGQFLSVRPDLLPPEALLEFERLQDRAPPEPLARVLRVVEAELGAPVSRLFSRFDPEPVACASLSQVHMARLPGGATVAVKVQRPGAARSMQRDLRILGRLARAIVSRSPLRERLDPEALWSEVAATAEAELDFRREAEIAEQMARNFRGAPRVRIPRVHWGWTSRRVLTTDFVQGLKISDPRLRARADYGELAELGARAFLKQVLEDGLFHADLHPANLLITSAGEIAYVDFGISGRLTPEERVAILGALAGLLSRDPELALRHLGRLGVAVPKGEERALAGEVGRVMDEALAPRLRDVSLGEIGRGLLYAIHRHGVVFPRRHGLLVKALMTIEGTARLLHPDFSFERVARAYLVEQTRREMSYTRLAELAWRGVALLGFGALEGASA